jgi:hypothetical protein
MASVSAAHTVMMEDQKIATAAAKPGMPMGAPGAFPMPPAVSLPGGPSWTDSGVPSGMGNAFTKAVTNRPIPADFGVGFGGPGAFTPRPSGYMPPPPPPPAELLKGLSPDAQAALNRQHQALLAQYNAAMRGQTPARPQPEQVPAHDRGTAVVMVPQGPSVGLIATLQSSPLPSEREMAADQLKRMDWKSEAGVVPALAQSARTDPAPMVRVSCVRALGYMKANTPEALTALEALRSDLDPRVRTEAAETLGAIRAKR